MCNFNEIKNNNLYFYIQNDEIFYKTKLDTNIINVKLNGDDVANNEQFVQILLNLKQGIEKNNLNDITAAKKKIILELTSKRGHTQLRA